MSNRAIATLIATTMLVAAPAAAQDAPAPPALLPALAGPLTYSPTPLNFEMPGLGKLYVTGVGSGLLGTQSNTTPGVSSSFADVSNATVILQKPEGVFQFLVQAGLYNQQTLGTATLRAEDYTKNTYGPIPQAWIKIAPSANFNVQAGLLPTMIGLEAPFTFQNMNVDRGVLWGQENVLTRGIQANFTSGKLALSASLTDGFWSGKFNWLTGAATYSFDPNNVLTVLAGGALSTNYKSTFATPVNQNNSTIVNVIYTHISGPVLIQPYFQYTRVPDLPLLGTTSTETWSGALLARYTFSEHFAVPIRFEYADSTGSSTGTNASVFYGIGSNVFTFTITPTYTFSRFFVRPEFSVVKAGDVTPGFAFGQDGKATSQVRGRLEIGVMF